MGEASLTSLSDRKAIHDIGVRGNHTQHHNEQSIISGMIVLGENKNILNKRWINSVAQHKTSSAKNKYVKKCGDMRGEFDRSLKRVLCKIKGTQRRNSMRVLRRMFCVQIPNQITYTSAHRTTDIGPTMHT